MHKAKGASTSAFPLRKLYTEQIFVLVRVQLRNHACTQPVKRLKRCGIYTQYRILFVASARE